MHNQRVMRTDLLSLQVLDAALQLVVEFGTALIAVALVSILVAILI